VHLRRDAQDSASTGIRRVIEPTNGWCRQAISQRPAIGNAYLRRGVVWGTVMSVKKPAWYMRDDYAQPQRHAVHVPYAEKDAAKQAGARWDPLTKNWYVTDPTQPRFRRWSRTSRPLSGKAG
jgi:hypothetical protein